MFRNWIFGSQWLMSANLGRQLQFRLPLSQDWKIKDNPSFSLCSLLFCKNRSVWNISTPVIVRARGKASLPFQMTGLGQSFKPQSELSSPAIFLLAASCYVAANKNPKVNLISLGEQTLQNFPGPGLEVVANTKHAMNGSLPLSLPPFPQPLRFVLSLLKVITQLTTICYNREPFASDNYGYIEMQVCTQTCIYVWCWIGASSNLTWDRLRCQARWVLPGTGCSGNPAWGTQGRKKNLPEFLTNKTGLTSADFKKCICTLFLGGCF